jgi:hypothetical protein
LGSGRRGCLSLRHATKIHESSKSVKLTLDLIKFGRLAF